MFGFNKDELRIFRTLTSPRNIQDFLDTIPMNFEGSGATCMSPRRVLRERKAHCIEGAMLAAVALRFLGHPPLLVDLQSSMADDDHVIAVYLHGGCWGAISKTNHGVLRFREPIYRSIRELAVSYFHEYFLDDGRKTLRTYTAPFNLSRFDDREWMTAEENLWYIADTLNNARHYALLHRRQIAQLRKADPIERQIGKITEWNL